MIQSKKNRWLKFLRVWHRRLSLIVGIQLFLWIIGGIYFAWFHIDDVHGDYERNFTKPPELGNLTAILPINNFVLKSQLNEIADIRIGHFLEHTVVRLYKDGNQVEMYDAFSGQLLSPITVEQAKKLAETDFIPPAKIISVQQINRKEGEYKGPIPAYRISFDNLKATHIYIHIQSGEITARRNRIWRAFDFLWMLHIMEFNNRENFNNWLLRFVSLLGLAAVLSGYLLWAVTRKAKN